MHVEASSSGCATRPALPLPLDPSAIPNPHAARSAPAQLAALLPLAPAPRSRRAAVERSAAPSLQEQVVRELNAVFPDLRQFAKARIEARLATDYDIRLDADRAYWTWFDQAQPPAQRAALQGDGSWIGRPTISQSLTELQLARGWQRAHPVTENKPPLPGGIYREGAWAQRFEDRLRIPLSLEQVTRAALDNQLHAAYAERLRHYWDNNFDTLQTLVEVQVLDYMETHRRAGNRALALGVAPSLGLSDEALAMVAEATGRHDPDLAPTGVKAYVFNINGWPARDMVWLRAKEGRVVLVMPGDARPLREYRDLRQMQDDIRRMAGGAVGRARLASHFSDYHRQTGWSYWGVDRWLQAIGEDQSREYDYAIADYYKQPLDGKLTIGVPDAAGQRLLSDKALAMVNEAVGHAEPDLPGLGTQAHLLDIGGVVARDIAWLQASDGRVVLLLPGTSQPVREYASLDAMRRAIAAIASTPDGRASLARHFAQRDRITTDTFQGVDQTLEEIGRHPAARNLVAFDPGKSALGGPLFHTLVSGRRQLELAMIDRLAAGQPPSDLSRVQLEQTLSVEQRLFNTMRRTDAICDSEMAAAPAPDATGRQRRAPGDDPADQCLRAGPRPRRWGRALAQRLQAALDRLRPAPTIPQAPPDQLPAHLGATGRGTAGAVPNDYAVAPRALPFGRSTNRQGFLERRDLQALYRVELVPTNPVDTRGLFRPAVNPLRVGFRPQEEFAAGRRALAGEVIDAYLTPQAAWHAFDIRHNNQAEAGRAEFRLYQIAAEDLAVVSFGDNEVNNPRFGELMAPRGLDSMVESFGGVYAGDYQQSRYRRLQPDMVQVRLDDQRLRSRIRLAETRRPNNVGGVNL